MSKALVNLHCLETTYCLAFKASFFNSASSGPASEELIDSFSSFYFNPH
jgi:hypothetical protein